LFPIKSKKPKDLEKTSLCNFKNFGPFTLFAGYQIEASLTFYHKASKIQKLDRC
jgi:hypothetical protein